MEEILQELMRGINRMFLDAVGGVPVLGHGPFRGMIVPTPEEESWADGNFSTKMLGTYEHELHDVIAHAVARDPKYVVNIGCADGYYAIGFARLLPEARVYASDINPLSIFVCQEFAHRNGVADRVWADTAGIDSMNWAVRHRLFFVDCEGEELRVLDPKIYPELLRSDIIVECHDFLDKDCSLKLADRFAPTHAVEIVQPRLPLFSRYEFLVKTPGITQVLMATEKRPMPTLWLACWANQKGDDNG